MHEIPGLCTLGVNKQQRMFASLARRVLLTVEKVSPESLFHLYTGANYSQRHSTPFDRSHVSTTVGCTWMPEVVKYGISNLTLIGGFPSLSSASTLGRPKWARIKYSFPPCNGSGHKRYVSVDHSFFKLGLQEY